MADFQCNNEEQVVFPLVPVTGRGVPAPIDGEVTAAVVAGSATVLRGPGENEWILRSGDVAEDCAVEFTADALVGDGVQPISRVVTLTVTSALAAGFSLGDGARVEPKPAPEPAPAP